MTPEEMIEKARHMRDQGIEPLEVYVFLGKDEWWVVPVPHDDSPRWPRGVDDNGNEVPMSPLQPMRLADCGTRKG